MVAQNQPKNILRIINSGDGKTLETAYQVYSLGEEYEFLRYFKLKTIMNSLLVKDGIYYDAVKTNKKTIYFKVITKTTNAKPNYQQLKS